MSIQVEGVFAGGAGWPEGWAHEVTGTALEAIAQGAAVEQLLTLATVERLGDPDVLPTGVVNAAAFSPDGVYLAVAHATSPFVTIYKRNGNALTKLANPSTLPAGRGRGIGFSPDGVYLAVAHDTTPFLTIYKRSGDTFTKLANPSTLPANSGTGISFSPDGLYLAVSNATSSPFFAVYRRTGDAFAKMADPSLLPTGENGRAVSFSPDSRYLAVAVASASSGGLWVYRCEDSSLTRITSITAVLSDVTFDKKGEHLYGAGSAAPYVRAFRWNNEVLDEIDLTGEAAAGAGYGISVTPENRYAVMAHATDPYITFYRINAVQPTKVEVPISTPVGSGYCVDITSDGAYMVTGHAAAPFVSMYRLTYTDGYRNITETSLLDKGYTVGATGVALEGAAAGGSLRINLFDPINDIWGG